MFRSTTKTALIRKWGIFITLFVATLYGCNHDDDPPASTTGFDIQIQAIEVTQGVRTDIPTRIPPGAPNILAEDLSSFSSHVAGRRTIVRVYPWIQVHSGPTAQVLSASLHGFNAQGTEFPDSPIAPQNTTLIPNPFYQDLPRLRKEAARSWNFVLPDSWIAGGQIRLEAVANPAGTNFIEECEGCDANRVPLLGTRFTTTANEPMFIPYVLNWANVNVVDGAVTRTQPSLRELAGVFNYVYKTWPITEMRYRSMHFVDTCVPSALNEGCVDPYTGIDNAVPVSPQAQQRALATRLKLGSGGYTLLPALISPDSINHVDERMGCRGLAGIGTPDYWLTTCTTILAHESAHAGPGRTHAGGAHGSIGDVDPDYPDTSGHGAVEENAYGFDILAMQAIPPVGHTTHTHDYMSYGSSQYKWTSRYTWDAIRAWLNPPVSAKTSLSSIGSVTQATTNNPLLSAKTGTEVATKPPHVLILNPRDGGTANTTQDIVLMGQAFDSVEGQLPDAQLVWQVDGQTVGLGAQLTIAALPEGRHTIVLQAINSRELQSTTSIMLNIAIDTDFDGLPDDWENKYGLDPLVPNASEDPDKDGVVNWREFDAGTSPMATDSDYDGLSDKSEIDADSDTSNLK